MAATAISSNCVDNNYNTHTIIPGCPKSKLDDSTLPPFFLCPLCDMPIGPFKGEIEEHYLLEIKQLKEEPLTLDEEKKLNRSYYLKKYKSLPSCKKEPVRLFPFINEDLPGDKLRSSKRQTSNKRKPIFPDSSSSSSLSSILSSFSSPSSPSSSASSSSRRRTLHNIFPNKNVITTLKKEFDDIRKQHKSDFQHLRSTLPHFSSSSSSSSSSSASSSSTSFNRSLSEYTCFLCHELFYCSLQDFNEHLDYCLEAHPASSSSSMPLPSSSTRLDTNMSNSVTEYVGASNSNGFHPRNDEDDNEGVDIQHEDQEVYGKPQYSESHLNQYHVSEMDSEINGLPNEREDNFGVNGGETGATENKGHSSGAFPTGIPSSNFVLDALKQKIQQLESTAPSKCHICLDPYQVPLVSVTCWHVHCESCWMKSLSMKKVCPQCQVIVLPEELRKIYM